MTRREKLQMAVLAEVDNRPQDQLGADAPSLTVEGYGPAAVNTTADELEKEGLLKAEIEYNKAGKAETVIPHGLTERGKDYLGLLQKAS